MRAPRPTMQMHRTYCRNGEAVGIEVLPGQRGEYRLRIRWPDGHDVLETFTSQPRLFQRLELLDSQLVGLHWERQMEHPARGSETDPPPAAASDRRAGTGDRRRVTRRDRRTDSR